MIEDDAGLQKQLAEDAKKRQAEIDNCPDNGRVGWWIVEGLRHSGYARASTAREAIDKCAKFGVVQDWEDATARFWTVELPEAF
jgi:hypothetical protein